MSTTEIAGLCKRLDILHEWQDSPRDRETITLSKSTLERQAAEIERLRGALTFAQHQLWKQPVRSDVTLVLSRINAALTGEDA
jgi:hypothetical protein